MQNKIQYSENPTAVHGRERDRWLDRRGGTQEPSHTGVGAEARAQAQAQAPSQVQVQAQAQAGAGLIIRGKQGDRQGNGKPQMLHKKEKTATIL